MRLAWVSRRPTAPPGSTRGRSVLLPLRPASADGHASCACSSVTDTGDSGPGLACCALCCDSAR